jgi:hypothetical protein
MKSQPFLLKENIIKKYSSITISQVLFYTLILFALLFNLFIALRPPNFLHPDEVFQTLEIAHSFVYNYGIVSWEWQVGSWTTLTRPDGYGPIRSIISPLIFSIFFILGEGLNLNYWTETLPSIRLFLLLNFLMGLLIASKFLKELDPDKKSYSNKSFIIFALFYHDFLLYGRKDNWALEFIGGFFVGLSIWIRPDSAVIMAFFVLINIEKIRIRKIFTFGFGFILSALLNGLLDLLYYGKFFISFFNFLAFNSENSSYFGVEPFGWYFNEIVMKRGSFFYLFIVIFVVVLICLGTTIYSMITKNNNILSKEFNATFSILVKLSLWCFLTLFWWEAQAHKEERFMVIWEISYLILGAYSINFVAKIIDKFFQTQIPNFNKKLIQKKIGVIFPLKSKNLFLILLIVFCTPFMIANVSETANRPWNNFNDILEAYIWLGQQNVTGVAILIPFWYDGGYSFLHKNIPVYHITDPFDHKSLFPRTNFTSPTNGDTFVPEILADEKLINYLIVPKYQYFFFDELYNTTVDYDFKLAQVIFDTCDIWSA